MNINSSNDLNTNVVIQTHHLEIQIDHVMWKLKLCKYIPSTRTNEGAYRILNIKKIPNKWDRKEWRKGGGGYLSTLSTANKGFANILVFENIWCLDIIPVLLCKWISSTHPQPKIQHTYIHTYMYFTYIHTISKHQTNYIITYAFFLPPFFPLEILLFFL